MHQDAVALTRKSWPTLGQRCEFSFGITWNNNTVDGSRHPARGHQLRESSEYPIIYKVFIHPNGGWPWDFFNFFFLAPWMEDLPNLWYMCRSIIIPFMGNPRHWPQLNRTIDILSLQRL